jgi:hypothetical protein
MTEAIMAEDETTIRLEKRHRLGRDRDASGIASESTPPEEADEPTQDTPGIEVDAAPVKVEMSATTALGKSGRNAASKYPLLVYAPMQWGDFVATEDCGASVRSIADDFSSGDGDVEAIAEAHGTTREHVVQALAFAREQGYLTGE